ncbi:MAG TPA: hypothetical protein V6C69_19295 [Trichormus sp.]
MAKTHRSKVVPHSLSLIFQPHPRNPLFVAGIALLCLVSASFAQSDSSNVKLIHLPAGATQPQAIVDAAGTIHLMYYKGNQYHGDLFYVKASTSAPDSFSPEVRINSVPDSACALGTIRGGKLALGRNNRIYVVWNGSPRTAKNGTLPFFFSQSADGKAFTPQRNVIQGKEFIDGGGSVTADDQGNVYLLWHAIATKNAAETTGRIYMLKSGNDGATFGTARTIDKAGQGTCGCCSMSATAYGGMIYVLYRASGAGTARNTNMLISRNGGATFSSECVQEWQSNVCPGTSFSIATASGDVVGAWETKGHLFFAKLADIPLHIKAAPNGSEQRYPSLSLGRDGSTLLTWTKGAGWQKGGTLQWQAYDHDFHPVGSQGSSGDTPVWSFSSAVALNGNHYAIYF